MPAKTTLALATVLALIVSAPVRTDDPVTSAVRFNREIIRIVQRKCQPCHAAGGLVMSLSNYRDARAWGRAIREELVEQRMPPRLVAPGYGRFQSDPNLTAREMATMLAWLDGGMPRGDDSDLPRRGEAVVGREDAESADVRLELPPQTVPAGEDLIVRRVTVDSGRAAGQRVARVVVKPGDRRVLRGALVFDAEGRWLGAWLPWQHAVIPPAQYAFQLPARARLVVELSYRGADAQPIVDRSAIEITFAPPTARGVVEDLVVAAQRARELRRLMEPTTIWAMHPSADDPSASVELRAERPDGSVDVLLWMPGVRHDWPHALVLQDPITLPAGTELRLTAGRVALSVLRYGR